MSWDKRFLDMADLVASWSKDRSTKVGSVLVGPDHEVRSCGFNGMPRGVDDNVETRHERPQKYLYVCHAEANCLINAARAGIATKGCTLYMNFSPSPCAGCCVLIIQAGVVRIVTRASNPFPGKGWQWEESIKAGRIMLDEAGVRVEVVDV